MAEGTVHVVISTKLYYFLDGKKKKDPETGKAIESFDAVIKRLCGYNSETG
jgi:hypothetical protein